MNTSTVTMAVTVVGSALTAAAALPRIAQMGFDIVYLPPIHPIGKVNRKGRNNSLRAGPGDVGSPWAIGSAQGGHDTIHPELGTLDDFRAFIARADEAGLDENGMVALFTSALRDFHERRTGPRTRGGADGDGTEGVACG